MKKPQVSLGSEQPLPEAAHLARISSFAIKLWQVNHHLILQLSFPPFPFLSFIMSDKPIIAYPLYDPYPGAPKEHQSSLSLDTQIPLIQDPPRTPSPTEAEFKYLNNVKNKRSVGDWISARVFSSSSVMS
jgi:hypothetical protein